MVCDLTWDLTKAVRYCSEKLSIIFSNILSWTQLSIMIINILKATKFFGYGDSLPIISDIERHL
jgi:hypothetical protein